MGRAAQGRGRPCWPSGPGAPPPQGPEAWEGLLPSRVLDFRLWAGPTSTWPGNPHLQGISLPRPVQKSR